MDESCIRNRKSRFLQTFGVDFDLVYSPYKGDIHSPGKRPFAPFAGGGDTLAYYPYSGQCGVSKAVVK